MADRYSVIVNSSEDRPRLIYHFPRAAEAKGTARFFWLNRHNRRVASVYVQDNKLRRILYGQPSSNPPFKLRVIKLAEDEFYVASVAGREVRRLVTGPYRTAGAANAVLRGFKSAAGPPRRPEIKYGDNPKKRVRMGRLIEVRYERDHGKHQGFYKHTFETPVDVFASEETIFAKGT
jgi:hypothetical protein